MLASPLPVRVRALVVLQYCVELHMPIFRTEAESQRAGYVLAVGFGLGVPVALSS